MKRLFIYISLICLLVVVGCKKGVISDYDDTEVAVIVRGEEITVGDLRFLYSDDRIIDYLDGTIKAKLTEQEVKDLNIDVSKELQEIQKMKSESSNYPSDDILVFADAQATKFGMVPEEYYEVYFEKTQTMVVYVTVYIEEILGESKDGGSEYTKKANML